ncbi:YlbL family protein [Agromyces mediolanus]|uniref:YlbL family protein n=1 Tax=Agromyces mediolanus TaxID=41986 RepID=UPI001E2F2A48|nr:PDZ domain-containing protein [Agromyces mediolanus]MCD1571871.1 PDZ domain-containing protein [Agromyces mediolanus]
MSLFEDEPQADPRWRHDPAVGRRTLRERIGWTAISVALVIGVVFALLPSPYVIEQPGPVYNTLGSQEHDGEERPLIAVPGEQTYPTDGELNLLTVSVVGKPGRTPNWLEVLGSWFDRTKSVVPVEAIFPPGISESDRDQRNQAAMVDSQQDAIAAALVELGYDFPREVTVTGSAEGTPAAGVLQEGDVIESVAGQPVHSIAELREAVQAHGTESPVALVISRDGAEQSVELTPVDNGGTAILGIGVRMVYDFPIDVEIQLDDVGGPSAGMMFALGIVDTLTPGDLTGGESIAGTGTIDSAGAVGPIGGIRQKMWGALDAGSTWFLAPASNCNEVVGNVPDGLTVFSVETLDQARTIVEDVADGAVDGEYASCSAG